MKTNASIHHGAFDVDENSYTIAFYDLSTQTFTNLKSAPSAKSLINKIRTNGFSLDNIHLCYESTYLGFSLYRQLRTQGIHCDVIATSSIPKAPGKKVKTDRIDASKLAEYYAKGLLTTVHAPTKEEEVIRDLIRSRGLLVKQLKMAKTHITSLCRRMNMDYRKAIDKPIANYWTQPHYKWLEKQINILSESSFLKFNLSALLTAHNSLELMIKNYDQQIKQISHSQSYTQKVKALNCFRGIDTLSSMTLITEFGDIKRFPHPTKTAAYAGLAIKEFSSAGKEIKFEITKTGNKYIRTTAIEACQYALQPPKISRALQKRRQGVDPKFISIADRCMHRLYRKSVRMLYRGKHKNKIKVACARELLCFIWEALVQID